MSGAGDNEAIEAALRDLDAGIKQNVEHVRKLAETTADAKSSAADRDRSSFSKVVGWIYGGFVAAFLLYLLYRGFRSDDDVSNSFMELGKVMVLPVVTLVLGHYYGSRSK